MRKTCQIAAATLAAITLAACGGGDDNTVLPSPRTAEGVYEGSLSTGAYVAMLVLENDQFHAIYTDPATRQLIGSFHGRGVSNEGVFVSTEARDYYLDNVPAPLSVNATYRAGISVQGTVTGNAGQVTFSAIAPQPANYSYNTPAKLSDAVGVWDANGDILTIAPDGTFTEIEEGCTISGALAPRASSKNVFDFTVRMGPAPCPLPNQQILTGHAVVFSSEGRQHLLMLGENANQQIPFDYIGVKR